MELACEMTVISVRTLYRIQKEARRPRNKKPLKKRKGKHDLDDFDKWVVRRTVANMYGIRKIFSNCGEHSEIIKGQHQFHWQQDHFTAHMEKMGFKWKTV